MDITSPGVDTYLRRCNFKSWYIWSYWFSHISRRRALWIIMLYLLVLWNGEMTAPVMAPIDIWYAPLLSDLSKSGDMAFHIFATQLTPIKFLTRGVTFFWI